MQHATTKSARGRISAKVAALRALEAARPAELGVTSSGLLVLWKLAARMNHGARRSRVWPTHATIAEDTGLSRRTVRRTIARLASVGLLVVFSGQLEGRANTYEIEVEELCKRAGVEWIEPKPAEERGDVRDLARVLARGLGADRRSAAGVGPERPAALRGAIRSGP